jgi:protein tyrosine phosphatase
MLSTNSEISSHKTIYQNIFDVCEKIRSHRGLLIQVEDILSICYELWLDTSKQ